MRIAYLKNISIRKEILFKNKDLPKVVDYLRTYHLFDGESLCVDDITYRNDDRVIIDYRVNNKKNSIPISKKRLQDYGKEYYSPKEVIVEELKEYEK